MSFLDELNNLDKAVIDKYLLPIEFPKNTAILLEGDPGNGCYLVDEGTVRLELINAETDTDSVLGFIDPGMFLGEFSLLDGKPRSASAFAHTDVKGRWLSKKDFEEICRLHPAVGMAISISLGKDLAGKMRALDQKIAGYMFAHDIDKETNAMVDRATAAQKSFMQWPEERVDRLLKDIADTISERAEELAAANVKETGIGKVEDKVAKIRFACREVYAVISGHPAVGMLKTDAERGITEIASPVGVVFGLVPVTNPISTIVFKTLICLKGRNSIILSCPRNALGVGNAAVEYIREVLERNGAPRDLVQTVKDRASRQKTMMFMVHPGVSLILATGGTSMVKAAYSSGTPAIGVGSGNAPVLICSDADVSKAAESIINSKSFDNGVICGSENNLIVVDSIYGEFVKAIERFGGIVLSRDEKELLAGRLFEPDNQGIAKSLVGKSPQFIAEAAGITIRDEIRLIVVPISEAELQGPYGNEKLAPVLSLSMVKNEEEGIQRCKQILNRHGRGHTAVIWTQDQQLMDRFGREIDASRILVNVGASQGCIGFGTGLTPSFTLGCGTFGGNSTTDNVNYTHTINVKRLAKPYSRQT